MFITRFTGDERRTWFGLPDWTFLHFLNVLEKAKDRAMLLQLLEAFLIRWDNCVECNALKVDLEAFIGILCGRGGQLIWLGGNFEKAILRGGPCLLLQCSSTFFGSWPLRYFYIPCDPFLRFFQYVWYYNQGFLRCFRDPIRVPRIKHRVPRIKEIGSLHVHTGYLTFSAEKKTV